MGVVHRTSTERVLRDIGRRIAELRLEQGLTQETLAGSVDISVRYLQRIEAGQQNVTVRTLVLFANALGVRFPELLDSPRARGPRRPGRPRQG